MDTVSWILLYLILPIALGVLGNLATPWVKSFFTRGSLSLQERRLAILFSNYRYIKRLKEAPALMNAILIWKLAWGLFPVTVVVILFGSSILWLLLFSGKSLNPISDFSIVMGVGLFGVAMVFYIYLSISEIVSKVSRFDDFKEKTLAKLIKLGGNPEELDKEETA